MDKNNLFSQIMKEEGIYTVFQPIVYLRNGSTFGYEALSRISIPSCDINIEELFQLAYQKDKLWELERLCRSKALQSAASQPSNTMLFINVDANIIHDHGFKAGFTTEKLQQYGISAENIIFEITEKSAIADIDAFVSSIEHYQKQRFKIAIDDFGSGYSGLNRVCSFSPEFLKIDMNLIRNIDTNAVKKSAVASTVQFCKQAGIKVIAEGIETEDELKTIISIGIEFGQGYYLQRPAQGFSELVYGRKLQIKGLYNQNRRCYSPYIYGNIFDLGVKKTTARLDEPTFQLYEQINADKDISEYFVVDNHNKVFGVLTRDYLLQKFGGQFGYNLSKRTIASQIMRTEYLSIDEYLPIDEVAELAMNRSADHVYDSIAVTRGGKYLSTLTVKDLLLASIQLQVRRATDANPLTGLPGNHQVQEVIGTAFVESMPWAVIYLDLDNFKAYNDAYGFSNGDLMLKAVANAMKQCSSPTDFLGHIGGDDFVIVSNSHDVGLLCKNICSKFRKTIQNLYSPFDWEQGYIVSKNRNGFTENFGIASLSIAVVTNKSLNPKSMEELSQIIANTKKECKQMEGDAIIMV